jgi:hypothetical protein
MIIPHQLVEKERVFRLAKYTTEVQLCVSNQQSLVYGARVGYVKQHAGEPFPDGLCPGLIAGFPSHLL